MENVFSHTSGAWGLGPGAWGLGPRVRFESHAQCSLSVAFSCLPLLTYISEVDSFLGFYCLNSRCFLCVTMTPKTTTVFTRVLLDPSFSRSTI